MSSPADQPHAALGDAIKFLRHKAGMTQEALSEASGLHTTEISHLESGRRNPTFKTLRGVAKGLRVPRWQLMWIEELFEMEEGEEGPTEDQDRG